MRQPQKSQTAQKTQEKTVKLLLGWSKIKDYNLKCKKALGVIGPEADAASGRRCRHEGYAPRELTRRQTRRWRREPRETAFGQTTGNCGTQSYGAKARFGPCHARRAAILANHRKLWGAKPGAVGLDALCSTGCTANHGKPWDAKLWGLRNGRSVISL